MNRSSDFRTGSGRYREEKNIADTIYGLNTSCKIYFMVSFLIINPFQFRKRGLDVVAVAETPVQNKIVISILSYQESVFKRPKHRD